jgi:predicted GIY-YIG superfamily endonuclease
MLRDRLLARIAEMGPEPDHGKLAEEVLGIRGAPPELARKLVAQALVLEDRRDEWRQVGDRICTGAPASPGVYTLRDENGVALYVGKANNLRRRLRTHFAGRRWRALKPAMSRVANAEWTEVGSELEALVREAIAIKELKPVVNVQLAPAASARPEVPAALVREVIVVVPSIEQDSAELVCARPDGPCLIQRTRRSGADLAVHSRRILRFFRSQTAFRRQESGLGLSSIVYSWLAHRGERATRIDARELRWPKELSARLAVLLRDEQLFRERLETL